MFQKISFRPFCFNLLRRQTGLLLADVCRFRSLFSWGPTSGPRRRSPRTTRRRPPTGHSSEVPERRYSKIQNILFFKYNSHSLIDSNTNIGTRSISLSNLL